MKKTGLVVAAMLFSALPAAGQLGPWGPPPSGVPAWIDANGNGVVDPGETTLFPELVFDPSAALPEDQLYIVLRGNPFDRTTSNRFIITPLFNPTSGIRRHVGDPNDRRQTISGDGISFSFTETFTPPPPPPGLRAGRTALVETSATGNATLLDTNNDGAFDTLQISGAHGAISVPTTSISLVYKDVNGNGRADYVSIDWLLSGLLGVKSGDPQVWLPLTANGAGNPTALTVRIPDPRTTGAVVGFDVQIPVVPAAAGGPGAPPLPVPALSEIGLLALSVALAAAGVLLVRGRTFV